MNRILKFIRDSLSMTSHEAKGVLVAFSIIFTALIVMWGADYFFSRKEQNLIISSPERLDSLAIVADNRASEYSKNRQYESGSGKKAFRYFNFDPNTATVAELQSLGLPEFIAKRIEKYRSKGGKFRKKEDLKKIYGLYTETYQRLEPYITLPATESEPFGKSQPEIEIQPEVLGKSFAAPSKKTDALVRFDLNTADTTELKRINGIGSAFAKRIVKFRDVLGGFASAEQVKETYGLPPETADELLKYGFVSGNVRKLKINQLSITGLRHPYLKFFQVRAIVAFRGQHGSFKSVEDLRQIKVLDEPTIQKLAPYLEF